MRRVRRERAEMNAFESALEEEDGFEEREEREEEGEEEERMGRMEASKL